MRCLGAANLFAILFRIDSPPHITSVRRRAGNTEALIVGYAMSRLDTVYLVSRGLKTWRGAFAEAARVLGRPPATFKNLRDEFDLVHGNARRGWVRPGGLRANRQRVLGDLSGASDAAVLALADRILAHDEESVREAVVSLADEARPAAGVAQRLLTGRLAEEYFMANVGSIVDATAPTSWTSATPRTASISASAAAVVGLDRAIRELPTK